MKIGILTFHFGYNYGGILQCYALQQVLRKRGHNVEILNYRSSTPSTYVRITNKLKQISSIKELFENIKVFGKITSTSTQAERDSILKVFDNFRSKYINLSPTLTNETIGNYANEHFDAIIVGSDQIWTSLYDAIPVYFFGWEPCFKGERYSYAACSAHKAVSLSRKKKLRELLMCFDKITVRDNTTACLINSIYGEYPEIVPDPTELYAFNEFINKEKSKEHYILTYILGDEINGGHSSAIKRIREITGVNKVFSIIISETSRDIELLADKVYLNLSPEMWVEMFSRASFVYTDSFHAILFSLKFSIPFIAYYRNAIRSSRLIDLKNSRGIKNIISSVSQIPEHIEIQREDIKTYHWKKL